MTRLGIFLRGIIDLVGQSSAARFLKRQFSIRRNRQFLRRHSAHVFKLAEAIDGHHTSPQTEIPLISFVVPLYNSQPRYLDDLLTSFQRQTGPRCELILSDDGSTSQETRHWLERHNETGNVIIVRTDRNRGIAAATNLGIGKASGAWIGLLDHDDALAPYAASRIANALTNKPDCQFLYTDELIVDRNLRPLDYFFKPAWDSVLLSGVNYINHLSLYRRERLLEIGAMREAFEGSQDYDLVLRYTRDLTANTILHLPYPAYLWRRHSASYSAKHLSRATINARKALSQALKKNSQSLKIDSALSSDLHRPRFDLQQRTWPTISVIIPNQNSLSLISRILNDLIETTDYENIEIIVVDNGTTDLEVLALYEERRLGSTPFRTLIEAEPFNFSRSVNKGVSLACGDLILILNNDIECIEPNWLKEMASCFAYNGTGIVGAKLIYPDETLQHAGVIAGLGGLAGHWFVGRPDDYPGPMGRLRVRQSLSVVTGACMLISQDCLRAVGPFDETAFPIAYNDVDFCLRASDMGYRIVWTPFAKLVHHESASRGSDERPENAARFERDKKALRVRHGTDSIQDRAFNPWYSRMNSDLSPLFLSELPEVR